MKGPTLWTSDAQQLITVQAIQASSCHSVFQETYRQPRYLNLKEVITRKEQWMMKLSPSEKREEYCGSDTSLTL
jgi:hypothetical protein